MYDLLSNIPEPAAVKSGLESMLSSDVFTTNSLYGVVILAVVVFLVIKFIHNLAKCFAFIVKFLLFWTVMHILAFETPIGSAFPVIQTVFKLDVLTSIAQLFVGTPVSGFLLWIQAYLVAVIGGAFRVIWAAVLVCYENMKQVIHFPAV